MLKVLDRPAIRFSAIAFAAIFTTLLLLARAGFLQALEIATYDFMVQMRANETGVDPRVVVVAVQEADLAAFGWPIFDNVLARAIDNIGKGEPRVMGVDIFRTREIPPGSEEFTSVIARYPNLIFVNSFGDCEGRGIAGPPSLDDESRLGFSDMIPDADGVVRRGLFYMGCEFVGSTQTGFALTMAQLFLARSNLCLTSAAPNQLDVGTIANDKCELGRPTNAAGNSITRPRPIERLGPTAGGWVGLDDNGFQFLVDYKNGQHPFRIVSLSNVYDGSISPDVFRETAVVIGMAATSIKDSFYSPLSATAANPDMRLIQGIELHGQIISQVLGFALDGIASTRTISDGYEIALLLACCALGTLLGMLLRTVASYASGVVLSSFGIFGAGYFSMTQSIWLPFATPLIGCILCSVANLVLNLQTERRERGQLWAMFSQRLSPKVATSLWNKRDSFAQGGQFKAQRMTVTALFSDLQGFTAFSQERGRGPADVIDWLNLFLAEVVPVLERHGAYIDKFTGDGIMALFGVPEPRTTDQANADAYSAICCAVEMKHAVDKLNAEIAHETLKPYAIRIGIQTGEVVVGGIGTLDRMDYTAIGDPVNTAARLESYKSEKAVDPAEQGTSCRILIGSRTKDAADRHVKHPNTVKGVEFEAVSIGDLPLKGKSDSVLVYRVAPISS